MANVYKPNLIQIRARYTTEADGDKTENVLWFTGSVSGPYTNTQLTDIQTVFDSLYPDIWKQAAAANANYIGSVITDWTSAAGLEIDSTTTLTPVPGTASGTQLPSQVAALVSWHVPLRFRGGHARTYFPYIASGAVVAPSTLSLGTQGSMLTAVQSFWSGLAAIPGANGGPVIPQLYRYRTNAVKAVIVPIGTFTVQPLLATQRRRLRKVPHT